MKRQRVNNYQANSKFTKWCACGLVSQNSSPGKIVNEQFLGSQKPELI